MSQEGLTTFRCKQNGIFFHMRKWHIYDNINDNINDKWHIINDNINDSS